MAVAVAVVLPRVLANEMSSILSEAVEDPEPHACTESCGKP
eukprot:CAMPEP_0113880276 /NCGR_PEP_ID=MMETSP0780_2-20120614/7695_1 /TAXON_ID=652834 /ORGANISM="Palpitomonas bilix" /LENGTH=40 /DNA_ID=CAMNT_0000866933 /DNA_START=622 /DNA_END=744 /DNA_ORIENTATION=+ /assembly_acc=CAM_ASM_000599